MPNTSSQAEPLLYLVHRIPYPPNKGDKLRSFNILRQLAGRYRVYLGAFVDDPADLVHVPSLSEWCEDAHIERIDPKLARLTSLRGLLAGEALSIPYYRNRAMRDWVDDVVARHSIRKALAFSGPMAQYLDQAGLARRVIDFCDLDSAKWTQYAAERTWPMSWLYRREGERLFAFERSWAQRADASTFVTEAEADLLRRHLSTTEASRIHAVQNGVDADFFSPQHALANPYPDGGPKLVFTGAMDYWPNIDAVTWFVKDILPGIRAIHPDVRFTIVGMNPTPAVLALAGPGIQVTGKVPDVRPWLAHADLVVAPLRIARGIQNKVLEAMAMAKPVVVSAAAATGLAGENGRDYLVASTSSEFVQSVVESIADPVDAQRVGCAARELVLSHYSWEAHLNGLLYLVGAHTSESA